MTHSLPAHSDRAGIYAGRGEFERALADYSEAIRLSPAPPCWARACRADLYVQMREFDKAVADYDQMGELGRGGWCHYKLKALAHFRLNHYDKALESITTAVELNPFDFSNLTWMNPSEVAECPDERLRQVLLELADKTIQSTNGAPEGYVSRACLLDAFGRRDEGKPISRKPSGWSRGTQPSGLRGPLFVAHTQTAGWRRPLMHPS